MRIANRNRVAALVFAGLNAMGGVWLHTASAQGPAPADPRYPRHSVPSGLEGAGGSGGTGGGVAVRPGREAGHGHNSDSAYVSRVRSASPPRMDPSRRIFETDCTRPFDPAGKGNLRCG